MCGIVGIAYSEKSGESASETVLNRMRDCLTHRGPDEAGNFIDGGVGLGHRRLSIVDLTSGQQPMSNEDGSLWITYNGEIYNHADFRRELEASGHVYKSHCDTETILHLYEEHGAECLHFLRGMFAFAIWDAPRRELFLARDRLGVKPLYFVLHANGSIAFASEIKSLFESGLVKPELNFAELSDQLANRGTTGEQTLFRDVKRLLPGHFLRWKNGRIEIKKYWDIAFQPKIPFETTSEKDLIFQWRELFRESIRLRLMADVPLGMFLSGGIDSSAICALMSQITNQPIKTFSVAFAEREANELRYARIVAEKFRTEHHEILVTPQEFFAALPNLIWHEDEPLGFSASVPLYFVSKLAQRHVKVVLTGEGSDEILAGYARYAKTLLNLRFGKSYETIAPRFVRRFVRANIETLPLRARLKLSRTFLKLPNDIENLYFDNFAVFSRSLQAKLFTRQTREQIGAQIDPYFHLQNYLAQTDADNLLDCLLYADTKTYLQELLMKQDQMSMAASIESRVPFLDYKLVEFTARLPEKFKLRGRETKWILRQAMRGLLPQEILTRPKMGFPVPVGDWLRNEFRHLVDEFVIGERTLSRGIFEPDFVREIVRRHNEGENHDERLWFLLNFEIWQRQFLENEKVEKMS
jgi:asparagine synthase (glutamine-hydrolysing)